MNMDIKSSLTQQFLQLYGGAEEDIRSFHAPGRVNLIGEHTDYNGGYVFPAALTFGTTMLIRRREDNEIHFATTNYTLRRTVKADQIAYDKEDDWVNYPKAVLFHLQKRGYTFHGYDVLYHGEIPNGAGLSSSASIEVLTGFGFLAMEGETLDRVQLALLSQEAENQFVGVNCGIMDQFTIAVGKKDHAVMLKCNTLEYDHVPFKAQGYKLVIGNTNKRRGLVDSEYNTRRAQCAEAVEFLSQRFTGMKLLGEIGAQQFAEASHLIPDETVRRRAQHVIEENDRVLQSVDALKANRLEEFGQLMIESHESLRDLYEVTCKELDVMVEEALRVEGVLGSRMTGAGFGGCTVSLVKDEQVEAFIQTVGQHYKERTGLDAAFYVADIGDGVNELH
jgi:galactokinase